MLELIDRQAALKKMCEACGHCEKLEKSMRLTHPDFVANKCNSYKSLAEQPTVEAEPVRHGRWKCIGEYEEFNEEMADYLCESCGYVISRLKNQKPKFCEGCGARMDATDTNDDKGGIIL